MSLSLALTPLCALAADKPSYADDPLYKRLYEQMLRSFNAADSAAFFSAVNNLEEYLLKQDDLHAYYTQRCNEIVFLMNRQDIFEAYKKGRELSDELREKKLDNEMYMAYNILGHIYRFCGNKEGARRCFHEVLERMEKAGYRESMPPIYMNLVSLEIDDNPSEALRLLDEGLAIAREVSPERVFDIETRRTTAYYSLNDTAQFLKGYDEYKKGVAEGKTSVHGRSMEVYHLAILGKTDEAVALAKAELGAEGVGTIAHIYSNAGRWQEAYEAQRQQMLTSDSLNAILLTNSMRGISDELRLYDAERQIAHNRLITLAICTGLLILLVVALVYIVISRRRHIQQLKRSYQDTLQSDYLKSAFIQNVSHEVRTPLNIITGFAQVIASPDIQVSRSEQQQMAQNMQKNANIITALIDEMLELSHNEATSSVVKDDNVSVNSLLRSLVSDFTSQLNANTTMQLETTLADDFTMKTNEKMLNRIIGTLLSNAAKNTETGSITLKAEALERQLILTVEDTGCGIPANEAEHIFERFVKLDSFKVGIGLGLSLCRVLTQRLGGSVALDTTYTNGARFIVNLPIEYGSSED